MRKLPPIDWDGCIAYAAGRVDYRRLWEERHHWGYTEADACPFEGFRAREYARGWKDARDFWTAHPWRVHGTAKRAAVAKPVPVAKIPKPPKPERKAKPREVFADMPRYMGRTGT
jgi:hypothetical protein